MQKEKKYMNETYLVPPIPMGVSLWVVNDLDIATYSNSEEIINLGGKAVHWKLQ